jgi:hypothetical protein
MTKNRKTEEAGFVVCLKNDRYAASLEGHKIYRRLHDPEAEKDGDLRVIDESGEDYVFPRGLVCPHRRPQSRQGVITINGVKKATQNILLKKCITSTKRI